jgi:hypothetical protein
MSIRVEFEDTETGNIIVFLKRRGRFYPILQDKKTRIYIKWLKGITIRIIGTVDYEGRKKNPIYIDSVIYTTVKRELTMNMINEVKLRDFLNEIVKRMKDILTYLISREFSPSISGYLLKIGVEYSSRMTPYYYSKAKVLIIWGRDESVHEGIGRTKEFEVEL